MTDTVQRWTGHVTAFEGGGFVCIGDYLDLKKEVEALRADAERYQMLRRGQKWSVIDGIGDVLRADEIDQAIDAAMSAQEK